MQPCSSFREYLLACTITTLVETNNTAYASKFFFDEGTISDLSLKTLKTVVRTGAAYILHNHAKESTINWFLSACASFGPHWPQKDLKHFNDACIMTFLLIISLLMAL